MWSAEILSSVTSSLRLNVEYAEGDEDLVLKTSVFAIDNGVS